MESIFNISQFGYYISKMHTNKTVTDKRKTKHYEIELYTKVTDLEKSIVDGNEYKHRNGNILIAKPGSIRNSVSRFECYCVHFKCRDKKIAEKYLDHLPTILFPGNTDKYIEIFEDITRAMISKFEGYELYTDAKTMELISLIYSCCANFTKSSGQMQYDVNIRSAMEYMNKNLKKHLTLSDIATEAGFSPSYFHGIFKEMTGMSPYKYLLNARINCAKNLLMNSRLPFSKIAEESGFVSQAYFAYVFKKEVGVSPKAYRSTKSIII